MHSLKLIAGLGNPGRKHERDRHNVGFWFVSRLAAARRTELKAVAKYHGLVGKLALASGDLWLLLPQTYMNVSGKSAGALARFYKIPPQEILVVHDELDFPPGTAKLKLGGGVAGAEGALAPAAAVPAAADVPTLKQKAPEAAAPAAEEKGGKGGKGEKADKGDRGDRGDKK